MKQFPEPQPRVYDLRMLFELRRSRPLTPPLACGRVFRANGKPGLVDATAALWPVEFPETVPNAGEVILFEPASHGDDGFVSVARVLEATTSLVAWPNAMLPDPQAASSAFAGLPPDRTHFRPPPNAARTNFIRRRNVAIARTRRFFQSRGFSHMDTPALVPSGGVETYLNTFDTAYRDHRGTAWPLSLPTSPEFALKKLLAEGFPRIFQLARSYRNGGELARWHEPEFLMLEWYRAGDRLATIMDDTRKLVLALAATLGTSLDIPSAWPTNTVAGLFQELLGIDLAANQNERVFRETAAKHSLSIVASDDWDSVFFKLFLEHVEPWLARQKACFVTLYPRQMGALARVATEPIYVERFEAYLHGVEICNGYQELTDTEELTRRFAHIQELRGNEVRRDPMFELTMRHGLPPCTGNALGLDRLIALLSGAGSIQQQMPLPFLSQFPKGTVAPE